MAYTLPATTYAGHRRQLKTIDESEECIFGLKSDSEGDESDRTIIARPAGLDARLSQSQSKLSTSMTYHTTSPAIVERSPSICSSVEDDSQRQRGSYAVSEAGTEFSEGSCPSLAGSADTTFYTNSSRNSVSSSQSSRSNRNRYPSIFIPRDSWHDDHGIKEVTLGMSPAQKIMLSPQVLSTLPQHVPSLTAPPSFGEGSSIASNSPNVAAVSSIPATPDLQNTVPVQGEPWGTTSPNTLPSSIPIEIAIDEELSFVVSPRTLARNSFAQTERTSLGYSTDWSEIVTRFPDIPGATPQEMTPVEPDLSELRGFKAPAAEPSDRGVQLSTDALNLLQTLTRSYSPVSTSNTESASHTTGTEKPPAEMKEREVVSQKPQNEVVPTPTLSDYSFSQLSIPSPGGFFSSLQASSRATWCFPSVSKPPSMPTSAVAENFYDMPWKRQSQSIETILEVPDKETTDGLSTARQPGFDVPAEYRDESSNSEDDDLYGAQRPSERIEQPKRIPGSHEYEAAYEDELKQAAEKNIDRTSDWLSQQNSYLSALRESNPVNDPSEYIPQTPTPLLDEERNEVEDTPARRAVRFLEEAIKLSDAEQNKKSRSELPPKDAVFLEAFEDATSAKGHQDAFLQATARLEQFNSGRLALPVRHVHSLLNTHTTGTLQTHSRPRYRGPFGQNPRATGNFQRTPEQAVFADAERKQLAMGHILPAARVTEAQRKVLYKGNLLCCPTSVAKLSMKDKKNVRVLDLAGAATGSWAWAVALKYPHVKIITVQARAQSSLAVQWPQTNLESQPIKPATPSNHKVVTVAELFKLPFHDNHFDVISARTLHMFLRSCPVPDAPSINEWDLTLKECMRVLKPGGVLDFVILDSHIADNSSEGNIRSKHNRDNSTETTGASISPTATQAQFNFSPTTNTFANNTIDQNSFGFGNSLKKRGYDADGGISKITARLAKSGFTDIKRQWIALPLGQTGSTQTGHLTDPELNDEVAPLPSASTTQLARACTLRAPSAARSITPTPRAATATGGISRSCIGSITTSTHANGRSRTPFPPAPRPISEVSSISRIIEQYANVEAVQGPVGSTGDVADMAGLLGAMMWEEWIVRHRIEISRSLKQDNADEKVDANYEATMLLSDINEILAAGYAKGACFRGVIGYAKKPKPVSATTKQAQQPPKKSVAFHTMHQEVEYQFEPMPEVAYAHVLQSQPQSQMQHLPNLRFATPDHGLRLDTQGVNSGGGQLTGGPLTGASSPRWYTQSAVERGEVGTIPMMIIE